MVLTFCPVCNLCGENHYTEDCRLLNELKPIKDTPTISRARLTLPSDLKAVALADGTMTITASVKFERGTHFGPYQAQLTTDLHPAVVLPLKIISKSGTDGYYLDTTDEESCNWMCLVAPATTASEQNLICYDMKQSIYFTAIRDILPGEELRVWYAFYYGLKLQALPLADDSDSEEGFMDVPSHDLESKLKIKTSPSQEIGCELMESLAQHLPAHSLGARTEKDRWQCRFCDTQERNVASYAKHLMSHYRRKCGLCNRRFYSEKTLTKHYENRHASRGTTAANEMDLTYLRISSNKERCVELSDNNSLQTTAKNSIKISRTPCKESNVEANEDLRNLPSHKINEINYNGLDPEMSVDKENWTGISQGSTDGAIDDTGGNVEKSASDTINSENYNRFDPRMSVDEENWTGINEEPKEGSIDETGKGGKKSSSDRINLEDYHALDSRMSVGKENWTGIGQGQSDGSTNETGGETKSSSDTISLVNYNIFESGLSIEKENWIGNDTALLKESNLERNDDRERRTNDRVDLEDYSTFDPEISVSRSDEEIITINNINSSDVVQTQLVLAEDGSVIYHVANIPEGVLTAEMENLGLLVVETAADDPQLQETISDDVLLHGSIWNTGTNQLAKTDQKDDIQEDTIQEGTILESAHTAQETHESEERSQPYCIENAEAAVDSDNAIALILLNAEERGTQLEEISNVEKGQCNISERSSEHLINLTADTETHTKINVTSSELLDKDAMLTAHGTTDSELVNSPMAEGTKKLETDEVLASNNIIEPLDSFACDICSKVFVKSAYLYRHLRKHTGEFTCVNCLAVFARKENLQSHPCSRPVPRYPCHICGKKFSAKKYLQRHKPLHTGEFTCQTCKKPFVSKLSLASHRCTTDSLHSANSVKCTLCERKFPNQAKLKAHILHHSETNPDGSRSFLPSTQATRKQRRRKTAKLSTGKRFENLCTSLEANSLPVSGLASANESFVVQDISPVVKDDDSSGKDTSKSFVCEICGSIFKSFSSMKTHRFLHGERRFECKTCGKRFHRKDVLQEHITVHQSPQLPCPECGKKFKTKKSLEVHMMIHAGAKRFTCEECGKEFHQKGNLIKHQRVHAPPEDRIFPCQHCHKTFTSREYLTTHTLEHTQGKIFQCPHCSKSFVKKHLLDSHQLAAHSNRVFLCRYCNNLMRHRHSARRHLEQQHPDKQSEWSQQGFVDSMLAELPADSRLLCNSTAYPGHLLSLRKSHFGPLSVQSNVDDGAQLNDNMEPVKNVSEDQQLLVEDIPTYALSQQMELLTDPLLSSNQQLQLDEVNVIPISFEQKKQGEHILLEVVEPQLQERVVADPASSATIIPISVPDNPIAKGDDTHITIGGNTYVLPEQVIFEQDEIASGDILLYVLDAGGQQ